MDALQATLTTPNLEHSLLLAFAENPDLLELWNHRLPPAVFADEDCQALFKAQQVAASEGRPLPRPPGSAPRVPAPDQAAQELLLLYQKRRLTALCQAVLRQIREVPDPNPLRAALSADLLDLEAESRHVGEIPLTSARELLPSLWEDLTARARATAATGVPGMPTGFSLLDRLTNGLETGLYLLAGPPKSGKTTFVNQLAYQVAAAGWPVVFVSFENDPRDLLLKHLCRLSGQSLLEAQKGTVDRADLEAGAACFTAEVEDRLCYVAGGAGTTMAQVRTQVKQLLAQQEAGRGLLVLDYVQRMALVQPPGPALRDQVNHLSLQLRDLSRELDIPILAVASLSREGYAAGRKAHLATLKESGNLEYDADAVWMMVPDGLREDRAGFPVTLTVAASRRSPTGTVSLRMEPSRGCFTETASDES